MGTLTRVCVCGVGVALCVWNLVFHEFSGSLSVMHTHLQSLFNQYNNSTKEL